MTQFAVNGPLREADFGHELRANPVCTFLLDRLGKGRAFGLKRPQLLAQLDQCVRVVTGANFARVAKLAILVIAHEQRAKTNPATFWLRKSTDDKLLTIDALEFQPVGGSALDVGAFGPLGNHPFPSLCTR